MKAAARRGLWRRGVPLLAALARFAPKARRPSIIVSTYAIGAIASFWFIERIWA